MSLLVRQDYANPAQPLWLGTTGGTISGNVTITGQLDVMGAMGSETSVYAPVLVLNDVSGNIVGEVSHQAVAEGDAGDGMVLSGDLITFGKLGTNQGNTTLTTSVYGAGLDNLTVGGTMNCLIGPVPTEAITSTKSVASIPVSPSSPYVFPVDNSITGVAGAEYDVQIIGNISCASGVPTAGDYINFTFNSGTGGSLGAVVFPAETGTGIGNGFVSGTGPLTAGGAAVGINMRSRVTTSSSGTILNCAVRTFLAGGSTAVYSANITLFDVQRVR